MVRRVHSQSLTWISVLSMLPPLASLPQQGQLVFAEVVVGYADHSHLLFPPMTTYITQVRQKGMD